MTTGHHLQKRKPLNLTSGEKVWEAKSFSHHNKVSLLAKILGIDSKLMDLFELIPWVGSDQVWCDCFLLIIREGGLHLNWIRS